jgi:hypothetical protein
MPATFPEAVAELDYWRERNDDMEALLDDDIGDGAIDKVVEVRQRMLNRLIESELDVRTPADLLARARHMYGWGEVWNGHAQNRIIADLELLVAAEPNLSKRPVDTCQPASVQGVDKYDSVSVQGHGQIEAALRASPSRSDRSIAREVGCSPSTVGKVRAAIGLAGVARSVQRRGQMFEGRYAKAPSA